MATLFLDPVFGISGNMMLGLLLDLGAEPDALFAPLHALLKEEFHVHRQQVSRNHIAATHVEIAPASPSAGDSHRHAAAIDALIAESPLPAPVKASSRRIFARLAEAEGNVHGVPPARVTFHEVGAVDSIVDIVGTCLGLHRLQIEAIYCGPLALGTGTVMSQHGLLPVPAPATAKLVEGLPLTSLGCQAELTTPTGAAIIRTLATPVDALPLGVITRTGYGAGTRDFPAHPNVLRGFLGEIHPTAARPAGTLTETVTVVSANIDDSTPEVIAHTLSALLAAGALDAWTEPVVMKKGRAAVILNALCRWGQDGPLVELLFRNTSTIGVRVSAPQSRHALAREMIPVATGYGEIPVKVAFWGNEAVNLAPEFDAVQAAALTHKVSAKDVYLAALTKGWSMFR